jgi:hypothetical protein
MTAGEFHQYARECIASAANAVSEGEQKAYLQMARTWTQAALRVEGALTPSTTADAR